MASAWKGYGQARWSSVFEVVPVPCTGLSCCSKKWTLRYVRPPPRNTASLSRHSSTNQLENVFPTSKSNPSTLRVFLPFFLPFFSLCPPYHHAARWRRVSCVCESHKPSGVSRHLIYDSVEHRREGLDDISWIFGMCEWRTIFLASRTSLRSLFSVQLANQSLFGRE